MEDKNINQIVEDIAKAWETLDAELIIANLDETFVYDSQWVLESLDYDGYIEYIRAKFKTIKQSGAGPLVKIVPDNYYGGYMIALTQGDHAPAFYRINVSTAKAVNGDLCMF